jgi:hypothetical protein
MLRITRGFDFCTTADSPDRIASALQDARPGRYDVEELFRAGELLRSGYCCQRWGTAVRHPDGQVTLDPEPWAK